VIGAAQPCPKNPADPIMAGLGRYVAGARLDEVIAAVAAG
jgi:hypothetical protein